MSRSDQFIGLNERANKWLEENGIHLKVRITREVRAVDSNEFVHQETHEFEELQSEQYDTISGAWEEIAGNLLYYPLKDGRQAREYVQDVPWSSGPMYFLALKVDEEPVPESLWTEKEMYELEGEEETQDEEEVVEYNYYDAVSAEEKV